MAIQRLDDHRLAEGLAAQGIAPHEAVQAALQQSIQGGTLYSMVLVDDGLVTDWELSRVAADLFNLPFLPVDLYEPDLEARGDIEVEFLRRYGLVPLDRHGELLTVAMPGIVPSDVLTNLARITGAQIVPVVGAVSSNRRWLDQHHPAPVLDEVGSPLPMGDPNQADDSWADMFDAADAAVQLEIDQEDPEAA